VKNIPERHGQADGRTDGQMTCNLITAFCVASRRKNGPKNYTAITIISAIFT